MRILVTGGAGFIGSWFVRAVLGDEYPAFAGAEVTVLDKLTYAGDVANLAGVDPARLAFVRGDVCVRDDLDATVPGHDLVINCAAESHVDRSLRAPHEFVDTNVRGAQEVFDAASRHGGRTVVHVSTDEVYGPVPSGASHEDDPLRPSTPYAAAKAGADLLARAYATSFGLDVRITRGSNTYGPRQYPEKIVPLFLTRLIEGRSVPLYGAGDQVRQWLHVSDHCRAIAVVAERGTPGGVYNVGGGRPLRNRELVDALLAATGRGSDLVKHVDDPRGAGHDIRYALDGTALGALGYAPQVTFEDGLAQTVAWYRANRGRWAPHD